MCRVTLVLLLALSPVLDEAVWADDRPQAKPAQAQRSITGEDRNYWAFKPPVRPPIPAVKTARWVRNPIDAFVLSRLEQNGLAPAPEADRATLLRRLSFGLTGLPPTPAELETFLADTSFDAYERVVDRLLASPRYGERWAQHWLDLARYADSDGFEFDQARPNAWRYRDWVVSALNRDVPYDTFIRRQLAGDETDPDDPDAFIATGFNRCYPDMVDLNDQALRRQNALNDITETTGLVFLGLTIGCARCHDHKFDPIRLSDFYKLQAFFTPVRFRDDYPIAPPEERRAYERRATAWDQELARIEAILLGLDEPLRQVLAPGLPNLFNDDVVAAAQKPVVERSPREVHVLYEAFERDRRLPSRVLTLAHGPFMGSVRGYWLARLEVVRKSPPPALPQARGVDETKTSAPPTYLLRRGDFSAKGSEVPPAVPAVLAATKESAALAAEPTAHSTGRRKALASWLADPQNPLTARVIANRVWQHHFGRGIVATPSDFGTMGGEPSHPELLDWLATELVTQGWSLKALHRLIVTSSAYRQSSSAHPSAARVDPENSLIWRHSRQRLDGEALRDALLSVSGRLNLTMGGPPVFPELPVELTKLSSKGAVWPVSPRAEDRDRRSLYVFVRRNLRYPFFEAFDRPDTNASCPKRAVTTIAPQALSLLNSQLANDCARAFATRVAREAGPELDARIELAYRIALGRLPRQAERSLARQFLGKSGEKTLRQFCLALVNLNEFLYVD